MKYVKQPIVIEAWQVTPGALFPDWMSKALNDLEVVAAADGSGAAMVKTMDVWIKTMPGDWIIKGVNGELYPCSDEVFRKTYAPVRQDTDAMDFGEALIHLKAGARVARRGWNGKGMWISYTPSREVTPDQFWSPANAAWAATRAIQTRVRDYLTMKTADNEIVPWVASQSDLLAEDWMIVGDAA